MTLAVADVRAGDLWAPTRDPRFHSAPLEIAFQIVAVDDLYVTMRKKTWRAAVTTSRPHACFIDGVFALVHRHPA